MEEVERLVARLHSWWCFAGLSRMAHSSCGLDNRDLWAEGMRHLKVLGATGFWGSGWFLNAPVPKAFCGPKARIPSRAEWPSVHDDSMGLGFGAGVDVA